VSWQLASFTLLTLALGGCFAWYERSRPSSRTVALVATLAALATLGRVAFAAVPDVKPTTDIVLLAGFALGAAPGFAVGAVAALASNVVLSQGPWTPWQMLAWGLCGIAGAALALPGWRIPRVVMALICAAAGFGFGFILDFYTWVGFTGQHTFAQYLFIEGEAFPFNLTHAIGNFVFYLAFGPALLRSLQRFRLRLEPRFVASALALAIAVPLLAVHAASASAAGQRSVVRAEVGYLRRAQNPDGGFGGAPREASSQLFTAWAAIGLAAAGVDPNGVERDGHSPVAWIEAHLDQLQGAGDLERTILALTAARAPLHALTAELRGDQARDRSFSEQSNLTAFGILALRAAHGPGVAAATAWLARQQNAGGGFGYATRGSQSDLDDTAACVEALVAGGGPKGATERAIGYLDRSENRDGGFPEQPGGPSDAQSTAWVVQAELAAGAAPRGVSYLERLTSASGSVAYAVGQTETPVWVTAQALAALAGRALPLRL
jgi:energy-coupling factor transport system substrate-specific component